MTLQESTSSPVKKNAHGVQGKQVGCVQNIKIRMLIRPLLSLTNLCPFKSLQNFQLPDI